MLIKLFMCAFTTSQEFIFPVLIVYWHVSLKLGLCPCWDKRESSSLHLHLCYLHPRLNICGTTPSDHRLRFNTFTFVCCVISVTWTNQLAAAKQKWVKDNFFKTIWQDLHTFFIYLKSHVEKKKKRIREADILFFLRPTIFPQYSEYVEQENSYTSIYKWKLSLTAHFNWNAPIGRLWKMYTSKSKSW